MTVVDGRGLSDHANFLGRVFLDVLGGARINQIHLKVGRLS